LVSFHNTWNQQNYWGTGTSGTLIDDTDPHQVISGGTRKGHNFGHSDFRRPRDDFQL
jgi:hypothetical protein